MLIIFIHVIGSGLFTNGTYIGPHGLDYHWGYKQLAFFCLNANLICISFFWHLWITTNGSVIRYTLTLIVIDTNTHSDTNDIICYMIVFWELNSYKGNFKIFFHGE